MPSQIERLTLLAKSKKYRLSPGDLAHMDRAVQLSIRKMLAGSGGPFGAVVVRNGKVIASGFNQVTSQNDPTSHAEIVAIRAACKRRKNFHLSGCFLYTSCEPCPMCLGAIYWARLERVYYALSRRDAAMIGFADDMIYREIAKPPGKRSIPMIQLANSRAADAFRQWMVNPHRVQY